MSCAPEKLSALVDGDLSARQSARLRKHIESCAHCRRELAGLESLRAALGGLPPVADGPDDWLGLVQRLAEPAPPRRVWRRWVLAPALAGACALAVWAQQRAHRRAADVPSDDVVIAQAEAEFRGAESQYLHAIERLRTVTARSRAGLTPAVAREFDTAQAALESATEQCRRVALAQPADTDAEALLFDAYRRQIRHYQDALLRSEVQR